jgi:hypothetical protein
MTNRSLFRYSILPPLVFNLWAVALYIPYYALTYARPDLVSGISPGQITFINYAFLVVVEWVLAVGVLRRLRADGISLRQVIGPGGRALGFAPLPALAAVAGFLLLSVAYFAVAARLYGDAMAASYVGLAVWQRVFLITVLPVTAAFCEELVWRAYIPLALEARNTGRWRNVALSSASFALIHGIFFPDKLVWTFLLGVLMTVYYLKSRSLAPAILAHWLLDVGSFSLLLFG